PVQTAELSTPKPTIVAVNNSSIQPATKPQSSQMAAPVVDPARQLEEIKLTLQGWASAWTAQEVDLYLSFYAPAFKPPADQSRRRWEQIRSQRLRKPSWVKVTIDDIQIEESDAGQARVRFIQDYRSENYSDITHKELLLRSSVDGWQILAESAL
ncbi:MAG: hypothetical protein OEY89_08460, partial [Gammaproteobacteria bacterium]|nr:hypothetical protein [Gammaproteobacteria bacterium]